MIFRHRLLFQHRLSATLSVYITSIITFIIVIMIILPDFSPRDITAPSGPGTPHFRGFTITLKTHQIRQRHDWTSDQPDAETST
jgi:hypothetical protein